MSYLATEYADPYDAYITDNVITLYTQKFVAVKRISRRGKPLAMMIAVRRLKRYMNKNGYQLCSAPIFLDSDNILHPDASNYVYVYARGIPKGYLPENTLISGNYIKVIDHSQIADHDPGEFATSLDDLCDGDEYDQYMAEAF